MATDGTTQSVSGARVLVTGATGFVGANLVRRFVTKGAHVVVLVRPDASAWRLRELWDRIEVVQGDLTSAGPTIVAERLGRLDAVYHLAAKGVSQTVDDDLAMLQVNIVGTYRALNIAREAGGARFVNMGSSGEYGPCERATEDHPSRPTGMYGATKACATMLAQAFARRHSTPVVVLRPFAVYGPFEASYRLVPYCILRGLRGAPIEISSGDQTRDYIHVEDVIDAAETAGFHPQAPGNSFNLCWGASTSVKELANRIATLTGGQSKVIVGARAHIPGEMWTTSGEPQRARQLLDWSPRIALDEGLRRTITWFKAHAPEFPEYRT